MMRVGIRVATAVLVVTPIACVSRDTSDTCRDASALTVPVPSQGLCMRVDRNVWQILPGTHSVVDKQASVLLKRRAGVGDVFISSPPMISVGTSVQAYRSYLGTLGNLSISEITTNTSKARHISSFTFEEWRDKVWCVTHIALITFAQPFMEKVLYRGTWQKNDLTSAAAAKDVLQSIQPQILH